jgi:hypothetical protein
MLFSLVLVLVAGALDAQAARRSSLAGNQFIDDADDMFAFPQLTMKYKNRVIIDMAPNSQVYDPDLDENVTVQYGNASVIFGDNFAWNFNTGRSDYLNNTASWAMGSADRFGSFPMFGVPAMATEWWDLGMATNLGDTPFGFNISWATDKNEVTPAQGTNTDQSFSMFSLQAGATLGSIDLAGEVGFGSYSDNSEGLTPQDQNDVSLFNFSLLGRGNIDDFGGVDWRWIAAFTTGSNDPKADGAEKMTTTAFRGSFGPVWGTPGEWEVAAYMNFEYMKDDFGGEDSWETMSFPAYNMAMEYYLNSWLVARGGVRSYNATETYTEGVLDGKDEEKGRFYSLAWTMGLGVDKGNWGLDLALNEDDVHSGYLPLNGSVSDNPIAYMTAWLAW